MIVYVFDVDHTLWLSDGPVQLADLIKLREQGHILGLCGNYAMVTLNVKGWHNLFSFLGQMAMPKSEFLTQIKTHVRADDFVMIGNRGSYLDFPNVSRDSDAAAAAGWRFISETEFAAGAR